jgi:hypothetical protein
MHSLATAGLKMLLTAALVAPQVRVDAGAPSRPIRDLPAEPTSSRAPADLA